MASTGKTKKHALHALIPGQSGLQESQGGQAACGAVTAQEALPRDGDLVRHLTFLAMVLHPPQSLAIFAMRNVRYSFSRGSIFRLFSASAEDKETRRVREEIVRLAPEIGGKGQRAFVFHTFSK